MSDSPYRVGLGLHKQREQETDREGDVLRRVSLLTSPTAFAFWVCSISTQLPVSWWQSGPCFYFPRLFDLQAAWVIFCLPHAVLALATGSAGHI